MSSSRDRRTAGPQDRRTAGPQDRRTAGPQHERRWHERRRLQTASVLALVALGSSQACSSTTASEETGTEAPDPTSDQMEAATTSCAWPLEAYQPYRHPLVGVPLVDGRVPGVDIHDSSTGRRFSIVVGSRQFDESTPLVDTSGVVELERETMTPQQRAPKPRPADVPEDLGASYVLTKRSPGLQERLASAEPDDMLSLGVSVQHLSDGGVVLQMQRAIGEGRISTYAEYENERMRVLDTRAAAVHAALEPVQQALETLGGKVRPLRIQYWLSVTLPASLVPAVEAIPEVEAIGLDDLPIEPASRQDFVRIASQVNQYVDPIPTYDGYDRSTPSTPLWTVGFGEEAPPDDEHWGFRDAAGLFSQVRMYRRACNDTSCWAVANFSQGDERDHPTSTLGLILGDLEDGQDPGVVDPAIREQRSGYSPEAWGRVYDLNAGVSWARLLEDAVGSSPPTPLINSSNGGVWDLPTCLGREVLDWATNGAFEDGTLPIWAGGNTWGYDEVPQRCTVEGPKGPGVFKVGTYGATAGENATTIRTAPISPGARSCTRGTGCTWGSPRGGVSWDQGRWRTIVDIAGYGNYGQLFGIGGYGINSLTGATSQATASVSGMAADFVHWFRVNKGYLISPGELRASLQLMGDRQAEGGKLSSKFSNLWGAGRLELRKFDSAGMDSPWEWVSGSVCIDDNVNTYLPIYVSPGADVIKAVAYWYDPRTAFNPPVGVEVPDDIDIGLQYFSGGTWVEIKTSDSSTDPKERVYASSLASGQYRLRISGYDVTNDVMGCGQNSMKVYYAYFYEDSARNDADGPGLEIAPE